MVAMDAVRSELRELLGLALPADVEFNGVGSIDAGDHVRERLEYEGDDGALIPAFLFRPVGSAAGGVVVYHQHNSEFHLGKSEVAGLVGDPRQAFGSALASRGVTVLAPDAISFEDRRSRARGIEEADGAVCSYARRQASGTGLGMLEVVPGLAKRLEVRDVIAAIQPRPLLVVSSTEDAYAADAEEVLRAAGPSDATTHIRVRGGHALDDARFAAIVAWLSGQATS